MPIRFRNQFPRMIGLMIGVTFMVVFSFWLSSYIRNQSTNFESRPCISNLQSSTRALLAYNEKNGSFPEGNSVKDQKSPVVNWRAALLPFKPHNNELGTGYQFDEPWDGPQNSKLHSVVCREYHCNLDSSARFHSSYLTVQGPSTFFPDQGVFKFSEPLEGVSNTILVVETHHSGINWLEPRDLRIEEAVNGLNRPEGLSISSNHNYFNQRKQDGAFVSFADGRVEFLNSNIDPKILRSLLEVENKDKPREPFH